MIGRTLGGFRIIEQIGMGGMATVFKAYDAGTDRHVAIKTLPQQYSADPSFRTRFELEAKAIAKLEHIHILPMFSYGEEDGIVYMAMRYLETGTLRDLIQQEHLTFQRSSDLLRQIAAALDYAHSQQIIHRDVKPSNILVDSQGNALLTDFGIAKMVESTMNLTGTGGIVGTPQYMSPEQFVDSSNITPASDQYSLAVVVYEMVTNHTPYEAETPMAILQKHLVGEPLTLPRAHRSDLPDHAEQVLLKALSVEPEQRYPSCVAFAQAFDEAINSVQPTEQPPTAVGAGSQTTIGLQKTRRMPDTATEVMDSVPATTATHQSRSLMMIGGVVIAMLVLGFLFVLSQSNTAGVDSTAMPTTETPSDSVGNVQNTAESTRADNDVLAVVPTETLEPTQTNTPEPTLTDTAVPTTTPEPTATDTLTPTDTPEPTATDTLTPTDTPEPTATDTPTLTDTPEPTPTDTPIPTDSPEPSPTPIEQGPYFDDFDDVTYEGSLDRFRWDVHGTLCEAVQREGILSIDRTDCHINIGIEMPVSDLGTLAGDLLLPREQRYFAINDLGVRFMFSGNDNNWIVACGISITDSLPRAFMYVANETLPHTILYEEWLPFDYDQWGRFELNHDPETTTFTCTVDNQLLGSYTHDNAEELAGWMFHHQLVSGMNAQVDNVASSARMPTHGFIDVPWHTSTATGTIDVEGWALHRYEIESIDILVDGEVVGVAQYGFDRSDIWQNFPDVDHSLKSGWRGRLNTTAFSNGRHLLQAQVTDVYGNHIILSNGSIDIIINN